MNLSSSKNISMDVPKKEMEHKRREQKYIINTDRNESVTKKTDQLITKTKDRLYVKNPSPRQSRTPLHLHLAHLINLC